MASVSFFAVFVGAIVLIGFVSSFLRHRSLMNDISEQVFRQARESQGRIPEPPVSTSTADRDYQCSNCGAALHTDTEVSPSGDFKCQYCDSWSNVHK